MGVTRATLKNRILTQLNLTADYQGFYTDEKLDDLIQESLDYVSVEMMMGGEGWLSNLLHITTYDGVGTYELPKSVAVINSVRYLSGNSYIPVTYDDQSDLPQVSPSAGFTQFPTKYRIIQNKIYFNPPPVFTGTNYLQIEYVSYPSELLTDGQLIDPQFDNAMMNFIKWRVIRMATATRKDLYPDYERFYAEWYDQMMKIVNKRIRTKTFVKEFQV